MPIITGRENVKIIYEEAANRGWVIPCFCTENLTTTEAVLSAASEYARENRLARVPITLAMTVRYEHRPQAVNYTRTGRWDLGLKLFRADAQIASEAFDNVDLLLHLDHAQYDLDAELLDSDLTGYSSVMYDASALPLDQNIQKTRAFTEKKGSEILIEGACDEIVDASGEEHCEITAADKCERYMRESGVDMVVANLGTEHRASGQNLCYHGEAAAAIRDRIGHRIVLHGTSSVSNEKIGGLYQDGICKVNIWTALERDSSPALTEFLVRNASKAAGPDAVKRLAEEGYLTDKCLTGEVSSLGVCTTTARQEIIFGVMKEMVKNYLNLWYK